MIESTTHPTSDRVMLSAMNVWIRSAVVWRFEIAKGLFDSGRKIVMRLPTLNVPFRLDTLILPVLLIFEGLNHCVAVNAKAKGMCTDQNLVEDCGNFCTRRYHGSCLAVTRRQRVPNPSAGDTFLILPECLGRCSHLDINDVLKLIVGPNDVPVQLTAAGNGEAKTIKRSQGKSCASSIKT